MTISPPEGYRFVELTQEEFNGYWKQWSPVIFAGAGRIQYSPINWLPEDEKQRVRELGRNTSALTRIRIGLFRGDEFCGWTIGDQMTADSFYMRNSAVFPEHRRKGLYTALMHEMLSRVKAKGFQSVQSKHVATNNAVIIPKLKAGFVITGMEMSDLFGVLVQLSYVFDPTRRRVLEYRAGETAPDAELKKQLGLS